MLVSSIEEMLFGAALIASGCGQLAYSWMFSEYYWLNFALICISLGIAFTILGRRWTTRNPSGTVVLGMSWCFLGLLATFAGVMLFAPLLILAGFLLALCWGVIKRKTWGRHASLLVTLVGLSASIFIGIMGTVFPAVESFPFVPSVVTSLYVLWYLNRPHVFQLFNSERDKEHLHRSEERKPDNRGAIVASICFIMLASFLMYSYSNPPSNLPIASMVYIRGSLGTGELGTAPNGTRLQFWASHNDLLNYSYQCTSAEVLHVWITYQPNQNTSTTIFETIGSEGSGSVWAPQTGNYAMWITTQRLGKADVLCEILVTSFSLRRPIVQSLILSLFGIVVALSLSIRLTLNTKSYNQKQQELL